MGSRVEKFTGIDRTDRGKNVIVDMSLKYMIECRGLGGKPA